VPVFAVAALILVAAGVWAYSPSFGGVFVLDDVRAIVRNPTIRALWPLTTPLSPPSACTVAGRPVANLSFAINYALAPGSPAAGPDAAAVPGGAGPLDPTPYHGGNLIIHLTAALVLFGVVRRTLLSESLRPGFEAAAPWLALAVALVWVVHPLQTAAVTYVVQRVESLMGLFYLLTVYCAIRASAGARTRLWAAAAILSCACGMATKEVMATAPIMVALWDHLFGRPRAGRAGRVRWGLVLGLAATWVILGALVANEHRGPSISLAPAAVWAYLLTQAGVVVHYLRLAFVPSSLVFLYDWPLSPSLAAVWWQAALLAVLVILTAVGIVRRHAASFLGAWFFLILAPSSSVLPIVTEVAAEHRMYLPLAAVVAAVVTGLYVAGGRMVSASSEAPPQTAESSSVAPGGSSLLARGRNLPHSSRSWHWQMSRTAAVVAGCAVVLGVGALGVETRARNRVYWSAEGLWHDTVNKRPSDARPRVAYGEALASADRLSEAEAQLQAAVALAPGDPVARVRLGAVLARQSRFDAAIPHLEHALTLRPGDVDAHRFLAEIYAIQRQDQLAVRHYERALAFLPDDAQLIGRLAAILADSRDASVRDGARALGLADRAVRLTSGRDPRMLEILSVAQAASGRFAEAASTARAAIEIARARGDRAMVSSLEYRASAYEYAARQAFGPRR
jgi:tetratricopeptide (TPR) repeat protein